MKNFCITGATGFIGCELNKKLKRQECNVYELSKDFLSSLEVNSLDEYKSKKNIPVIDCVVHLAARAHVLVETELNPEDLFNKINFLMVKQLIQSCKYAKIKNFIFISSIGVCGTNSINPFDEESICKPEEAYAASKLKAEKYLIEYCNDNNINLIILRFPLVYGPNVKGNFEKLILRVNKSKFLPFGLANKNKRSFLSVHNACDSIMNILFNSNFLNEDKFYELFIVSDKEQVSTKELILLISKGLNKKCYLLPIPMSFMKLIFLIIGKNKVYKKVFGSLQVNSEKFYSNYNYEPKINIYDGILEMSKLWKLKNDTNI